MSNLKISPLAEGRTPRPPGRGWDAGGGGPLVGGGGGKTGHGGGPRPGRPSASTPRLELLVFLGGRFTMK